MSEIDFKARAEQMHRRAQKAEGALSIEHLKSRAWEEACKRAWRDRAATEREARDLRDKINRLGAGIRDPLDRIIHLGKNFS